MPIQQNTFQSVQAFLARQFPGFDPAEFAPLLEALLINFIPGPFTVATLPSAASYSGAQTLVTDALNPIIDHSVVGGGGAFCPVYSDGHNWLCGTGIISGFLQGPYTVATLPSAAANANTITFVTDALAPQSGSPVVGGGAIYCPVYCDGSTWLSFVGHGAGSSSCVYQTLADFIADIVPSSFNSVEVLSYATPGDLGNISMTFVRGSAITATNLALWSRDFTQAPWAKTNVTATKDQTDYNGNANACSLLTATAPNATVYQSITSAAFQRLSHCYIKPVTQTGTIWMTNDGGTTLRDITTGGIAQNSGWERQSAFQQNVTNPVVGFKFQNAGDSIIADHFMTENNVVWEVSSPEIDTTSAQVTALQPWCVQSADGAYWYLANYELTPQMFGAKADGVTNDSWAFQTAIDYCMFQNARGAPFGGSNSTPMTSIIIPNRVYKINATLRPYATASSIKITGDGNFMASNQSSGPLLTFPAGTTYIDQPSTSNFLMLLEGFGLTSPSAIPSASTVAYGIRHGQQAKITRMLIENATLDGIFGDCAHTYFSSPNLDGSHYEDLQIDNPGRHGIYLLGSDANVCYGANLVFHAVGGSNIVDFGYYGSRWVNILTEGNGSKAYQRRPGIEGGVCKGSDGNQYQVIPGQEANASTTDPVTDSGSSVWAPCFWKSGASTFQALGGSAAAALPTWSSGKTWVAGPVIAANNGTSQFNGVYIESGYSPPYIGTFGLISGMDSIQYFGPGFPAHLDFQGQLVVNLGSGFRSINNCNPRSASTYTWEAFLGRASLNFENPTVLVSTFSLAPSDTFTMQWDTTNLCVGMGYVFDAVSFAVLQTGTPLQFGRGASIGGTAWLANGVALGTSSAGRFLNYGSAAPGSGAHAGGDLVLNNNPTVSSGSFILGWTCTAAGSPGTWSPIYASVSPRTVPAAYSTNSTAPTADNLNLAAADITGGCDNVVLDLTGLLGAASTLTLPTVSATVAAIPGAYTGMTFFLDIGQEQAGAFDYTLTTNTGWTLSGTLTIAQNTWRRFLVTLTSLTTATIVGTRMTGPMA